MGIGKFVFQFMFLAAYSVAQALPNLSELSHEPSHKLPRELKLPHELSDNVFTSKLAAAIINEGSRLSFKLNDVFSFGNEECSQKVIVTRNDLVYTTVYLEHSFSTGREWLEELKEHTNLDLGDGFTLQAKLDINETSLRYVSELKQQGRLTEQKTIQILNRNNNIFLSSETKNSQDKTTQFCSYYLSK